MTTDWREEKILHCEYDICECYYLAVGYYMASVGERGDRDLDLL